MFNEGALGINCEAIVELRVAVVAKGSRTVRLSFGRLNPSGQKIVENVRFLHACEPDVESLVFYREALVVDAEQVQQRCIEVANVNRLVDNIVAEVVGFAVNGSALHSGSGHPDTEATRVVVATVVGL